MPAAPHPGGVLRTQESGDTQAQHQEQHSKLVHFCATMDQTLQSGLDKRTRVGAWQSRVYRLERGYLSAWPDVVSAAAKEQPSRTECLFEDNQVATVTDQGDRRFKLEFPWDGAKTLSLRANNAPMKKAWMSVLQSTLREAKSQIQATGSVFAYGGTAHHAEDEAYEEAAYLKTNRFVAAYVVDEQSRASYVNDLLNERFHHVGERPGGGQDVLRACSGANAALEELVALTEDFKQEMLGLEELRREQGGGGGESGQGDPSVSAPKIARFCEEHLDLVGRLVASRLMLELSPFMDSSVAGTAAAPTESTRAELVATRRKLDEAYATTNRLVVSGTRAWFMDIRGSFLDCSGLANAKSKPPPPPPPPPKPEITVDDLPAPPPEDMAVVSSPNSGTASTENGKRPTKLTLSNAFSAAKAATKVASIASSSRGKDSSNAKGSEPGRESKAGMGGVSMRGMFRRGSRKEKDQPVAVATLLSPRKSPSRDQNQPWGEGTTPSTSPKGVRSSASPKGARPGASPKGARPPETEERERSDLFGGSSRSPSTSPRPTRGSRPSPFSIPSRGAERIGTAVLSSALPSDSGRSGSLAATSSQPLVPATSHRSASLAATKSQPLVPTKGARKEKRAFAGGLWGSDSSAMAAATGSAAAMGDARVVDTASSNGVPEKTATTPTSVAGARTVEHGTETGGNVSARADRPVPDSSSASASKPDASGGKRRFAGGVFSVPSSQSSSSAARSNVQASNPFGAGSTSVGSGGASTQSSDKGREKPRTPPKPIDPKPAWATEGAGDTAAVPDWAMGDASAGAARGGTTSPSRGGGGQSNGFGLAPPSREGQGQEAAEKSVFMRADADVPVRRPSRRRPGESGEKRAFGGGERLF